MNPSQEPSPQAADGVSIPGRAKGEVKVWLTAAGLTTGLLMVIGLLSLILWNGITVFWPKRIHEFVIQEKDKPETRVAGELVKTQAKRSAGSTGVELEVQIFTGNKDAYGLGFRFIDQDFITGKTQPKELILAERMEYGDSIFYPVALQTKDGPRVEAGTPAFLSALKKAVRDGNHRRDVILKVEKGQIGRINARMQEFNATIRGIELNNRLSAEEKAKRIDPIKAQLAKEEEKYQELAEQARKLREEQDSVTLLYKLPSGEERSQAASELVHFYAPNQLGFFGQLGVFIHHVWEFITAEPREANTEGGIFPAIFGTFVMTILMAVMVTPFGVVAAIYLREYAKQGLLVRIVRICVNNLAGVPSIVFGVFGLGFFVYGVGSFIDGGPKAPLPPVWWSLAAIGFIVTTLGAVFLAARYGGSNPLLTKPNQVIRYAKPALAIFAVLLGIVTLTLNPYFGGFFRNSLPTPTFGTGGILWASLTLSLMTLPVVIVATEEALAAVPRGVREAALACGASKWQTIQRVVLPSALPGVMTGVILAMARGAGEVAPLMITGVVKLAPSLPLDLSAPFIHAERKFMHLGFHIYDLGFQSPDSEAAKPMVFATTLFLILLVVLMNLAAISIRNRLRKKYQASAF